MAATSARGDGSVTAVLDYHRLTSYAPPNQFGDRRHPRMVRGYRPMDPDRKPPQVKTYAGCDQVDVPAELSDLLFLSNGVVRYADHPRLGRMWFRAAGSAGNLHPLEVYVIHGGTLSHYDAVGHRLTVLAAAPAGPTTLVVTGVPWRTGWKYTERGFRHLYWDCGTMLAQLLALAPGARVWLGFVDDHVRRLVGADGVHEHPLAVVTLDADGETGGDAGALALPPPADHAVPTGRLDGAPLEFPLVTDTQRATELADDQAVSAWRASDRPPAGEPLPIDDVAGVIRRRGSTREFDPWAAAPAALLEDGLAIATRPVPGDFVEPGGTLLSHYVAVHDVDSYKAGAYRWTGAPGASGAALEPVHTGDVRAAARHLCLDQDLGGNGSYTAFHCADLAAVTERLGGRGYRAALLEAGIVEGRLHLAAFSLGFGATGLTFFDDAVRQFFATDDWPMLCTAVGQPASRAPRVGQPGQPVPLRR